MTDQPKDLTERLDSTDVQAIDLDALAYAPLGEIEGASEKAIREAVTVPVTAI